MQWIMHQTVKRLQDKFPSSLPSEQDLLLITPLVICDKYLDVLYDVSKFWHILLFITHAVSGFRHIQLLVISAVDDYWQVVQYHASHFWYIQLLIMPLIITEHLLFTLLVIFDTHLAA